MRSAWAPSSLMSVAPTETSFVPTTDRAVEECPRFRILVVGRSGKGEASLINAIFGTTFADVARGQAGAIINQEIISQDNKRLAIHYLNDCELGSMEKFGTLKKFIAERSQKSLAQRLHAIWLCITTPSSGGPKFALDERIFKLSQNKVPIIVVFTEFDDFVSKLAKEGMRAGKSSQELAETEFKERYGRFFETSTKNGLVPYTVVATSQPETLRRLVEITMRSIQVGNSGPLSILARFKKRLSRSSNHSSRSDEKLPSSAQIILAAAQRVDTAVKIAMSIKYATMTKLGPDDLTSYYQTIVPDEHFSNVDLQKCLCAIHKDLVTIWNIQDLDDLLGDIFRRRMTVLADDLNPENPKTATTMQSNMSIASATGSLVNGQTNGVHYRLLEHIRCLMRYVVDLTLILQAVFQVSFQNQLEMKVASDRVSEIIYEFVCSGKKDIIHKAITAFVGDQHPPASSDIVEKIESLIKENEMKESDLQFDRTRPPLSLLLAILRIELPAQNAVNRTTLDFMIQLLNSPNYHAIASELSAESDVELLLDFILCLLRNSSLVDCGVPEANQKARRLMDKLSRRDILPKSLFITDVKTDLAAIGMGGFGNVFKGEHEERFVALKVLYRASHNEDSLRRVFCREALAWRSLSHRFILPLLGIYEEKAWLFLVSPLMENKTLAEWRRNQRPDIVEIHRLIREVAEGIQYIHSEGIIHGDLHGVSILISHSQ
ncbi:hypothetical protein AX14_000551 [Amanita brunnescens Koide BX004]|nr:hypothetical protein AX14_000551 [Amanita brunnescens Koide BX004]